MTMPLKKETRHAVIAGIVAMLLTFLWAYTGAKSDERIFGIPFSVTFNIIIIFGTLISAGVFFLIRLISSGDEWM
jgi:hypothetical protein